MKFQPGNQAAKGNSAARNRARLARDLLEPHLPTAVKKLIELMDSDDPKIVKIAATEIIDRVCGKAHQAIDISDETGTIGAAIIEIIRGHAPVKDPPS